MNFKYIKIVFITAVIILLPTKQLIASIFDTPVAMVTSFNGKVNFKNSTNRKIDFGTDIFIGDMISIKEDSTISLTFYNGCRQEIIDQKSIIQVGPSKSIIHKGKFKQIKKLDCKIPKAILKVGESSILAGSHIKAGFVIRGVTNSGTINSIEKLVDKNSFKLIAWTNNGKNPIFKIGEPILLHLVSNQGAYLLINYYSSDGELYKLTPELFLDDNKINIGKLYSIGNTRAGLIAGHPEGTDYVHIIASDKPISIKPNISKAKSYHQALKTFIANNSQHQFSEQTIKLIITQ